MQITRIRAYRVALPLHEGSYKWSGGKSVSVFDSTVVEVETDKGVTGWGEVCPLGPFYLPAFGPGARTGIAEIGQHLLGLDPRELGGPERRMDAALKGHPYVKSAIDMACWDILGKAAGLPVCVLLGGRYGEAVELYRAISQESAAKMAASVARYRSEGYRKFQLKVGADPDEDIARIRAVRAKLQPADVLVADANTGWLMHQAARVVRAVADVDVYIEQPCLSFEECLAVRRRTSHPFVLDETIDSVDVLLRAHADGRHGRDQPQDLQGGRPHEGAPDPRPVRLARHRDDDRGLVGRRHHDRRDRAPRALDARGAALLRHRLQQLRDGEHRRGRAEAEERADGGLDRAGPRRAPARSRCSAGRSSRSRRARSAELRGGDRLGPRPRDSTTAERSIESAA